MHHGHFDVVRVLLDEMERVDPAESRKSAALKKLEEARVAIADQVARPCCCVLLH